MARTKDAEDTTNSHAAEKYSQTSELYISHMNLVNRLSGNRDLQVVRRKSCERVCARFMPSWVVVVPRDPPSLSPPGATVSLDGVSCLIKEVISEVLSD